MAYMLSKHIDTLAHSYLLNAVKVAAKELLDFDWAPTRMCADGASPIHSAFEEVFPDAEQGLLGASSV